MMMMTRRTTTIIIIITTVVFSRACFFYSASGGGSVLRWTRAAIDHDWKAANESRRECVLSRSWALTDRLA
jgi:hypothetical protein